MVCEDAELRGATPTDNQMLNIRFHQPVLHTERDYDTQEYFNSISLYGNTSCS